jgi:taurine--2-oxoglutarate transaminase
MAEHFRGSPNWYGSTYNGHPVALASAYAALKQLLRGGYVENAAAMAPYMEAGFERLAANHPCIKQARGVGVSGIQVQ